MQSGTRVMKDHDNADGDNGPFTGEIEPENPLNIELTKNIRKFVIPNLNPFQTINFLKEEAVSSEMSPHYLFFENPDGFHFRSLDSLIGSQGSLNVPHKRVYKSEPPDDPRAVEAALGTILHWEA